MLLMFSSYKVCACLTEEVVTMAKFVMLSKYLSHTVALSSMKLKSNPTTFVVVVKKKTIEGALFLPEIDHQNACPSPSLSFIAP